MGKNFSAEKTELYLSSYLFSCPSFLSGVAKVLDLGATFDEYNTSETTDEADYRAFLLDWSMVSINLKKSIANVMSHG
ncbi:MAG: hypothetical protein HY769_07215 [Candidatus Stahlbacteria bacterium]|nr:hypothetical protein [Candidatus Stahlbacteria bacterium]